MMQSSFREELPGTGASTGSEKPETSGVSIAEILHALVKNRWLILVCTLLCTACALTYVVLKRPVYEAAATLRIDPTRAGSLGLGDLISGSSSEAGDQIPTEIAILESDRVALSALNALSPEMFKAYAGFPTASMTLTSEDKPLSRSQENLISHFKSSLTVKQVEGTQLVRVGFRDNDPAVAERLVNNTVAAYLRQNFDSRHDSVDQVRTWLSSQMDELRQRAAAAQSKLADFQERNNILGAGVSDNGVVDRLKLLNESLTQAESNRIIKEAQMRAASTGDASVLASLFPDPHLQALQAEEGSLYSQYVQLSTKFGAAYPPLVDLKQQLARVKETLSQDVSVISARLREEYDASLRTENMLRAEYGAQTAKAFELNRNQAEYAVLVAEGSSSRDLYNTLQYKLQQASVDAGLNAVNTMIVDRARIPVDPVEPKRSLILAFGVILGLASGIGASLLRESMSDQISTVQQIESASGLPTLATVPHLPLAAKRSSTGEPALAAVEEPQSYGADAYRNLRNSVLFASIDRPLRIVLVTSAMPGEGKTSTSANYAAVLAQKGSRVLLIDADLRRPTLHRLLRTSNKIGLGDHLLPNDTPVEVSMPIAELPNLHFLSAGTKVPLPSEALASTKFRSLVERFKEQYDTVVIDSAPILTVSDTVPVASWVDAVIIVARAGVTPMQALLRTKSVLMRARARIVGVLLNDVTKANDTYGTYGKEAYEYHKGTR